MSQSSQYDLSRISIGGFSAGANLALATSTLHGASLTSCIAFYPPTNFTVGRARKQAPKKHAAALPPWIAQFFDRSYIVAGSDRGDPLISPLLAEASSFPRNVWVTCARGDTLYNDGKAIVEHLKSDAPTERPIRAEFHNVNGEGHGFDKVARKGTERGKKKDEAFKLAIDFVKSSWGGNQGVERAGAKL